MKSERLPVALREAIARFVQDVPQAELVRRARALSENYRARGNSALLCDTSDVAAYLTARLPATYAAIAASLRAAAERLPDFAPKSLLDAGAGPGSASWAAATIWPSLQSVTMRDSNPRFLGVARGLAQASGTLRHARFEVSDIAVPGEAAELVVAAYALAEIAADAWEAAVGALWQSTTSLLVIVEPGTPDGFARIRRARRLLLQEGARIAAPCAGGYDCPIVSPDWCHFAVRLPRSRAHLRAKAARVPFEDEKFSYLAAARDHLALVPAAARILARPHASKAGVSLRLCADGRIVDRLVPKRDKDAYRRIARKDWGDAI